MKWQIFPFNIRVVIALVFLFSSVISNFISITVLFPFVVVSLVGLFKLRAFTLRKSHWILFISLSFMYLWLHILKIDQSAAWFAHSLISILFFYIFVLLITQGIKIYEWLYLFNGFPFINSSILGISCAFVVLDFEQKKALTTKKLSRKNEWLNQSRKTSNFYNSIRDLIILDFTIASDLYHKYTNWKTEPTRKNSNSIDYIMLHQIYDVPYFAQIYKIAFGDVPIATAWIDKVNMYIESGSSVLEIGAGTGRFTTSYVNEVTSLVAIEPNKLLFDELVINLNTYKNIDMICGFFPEVLSNQKKFEVIILHQNVFLELINQVDLDVLCGNLQEHVAEGGIVLFDYLDAVDVRVSDNYVNIINDNMATIGHVEYDCKITEYKCCKYSGLLRLSVINKLNSSTINYENKIEIHYFDLSKIIDSFARANFTLISNDDLHDSFTLFPAKMVLLTFKINN